MITKNGRNLTLTALFARFFQNAMIFGTYLGMELMNSGIIVNTASMGGLSIIISINQGQSNNYQLIIISKIYVRLCNTDRQITSEKTNKRTSKQANRRTDE